MYNRLAKVFKSEEPNIRYKNCDLTGKSMNIKKTSHKKIQSPKKELDHK